MQLDNDDLTTLDNIEAADQSQAKPEQETPFDHIPPDEIRAIDDIVIDMPAAESMARKLPVIRMAIESIESTGRISHSQAQEIAVEVPAIFGTKEEPVAYSSQPTTAGAEEATEILKSEEGTIVDGLRNKVKAIAEKKLTEIEAATKEAKNNYAKASSDYVQARQAFFSATGENPETAVNSCFGNTPISEALFRRTRLSIENGDVASSSRTFAVFLDAIKEILGPGVTSTEALIDSGVEQPHVFLGPNQQFLLSDLTKSEIKPVVCQTAPAAYLISFLLIPQESLQAEQYDGATTIFGAVTTAIDALTHQLTDDVEDLYTEATRDDLQALIGKVSLKISLIDTLVASAVKISQLVDAGNALMVSISQGAAAQVSMAAENQQDGDVIERAPKGFLFSKRYR